MAKKKDSDQTSKRWLRRAEQRPEEILSAAIDCFAENGFTATKLDEIARRAGVSKGTLYLYFSSKEEIFKSLVRSEMIPMIADFEKKSEDRQVPAADSLRLILQSAAGFLITSKFSAIPKLIIAEAGNFPELARFYHEEVIERATGILGKIISRGVKTGEFRSVNVEHAVYSVIAPVLIAVVWKHSLKPYVKRDLDIETLFQTHTDLILEGLMKKRKK